MRNADGRTLRGVPLNSPDDARLCPVDLLQTSMPLNLRGLQSGIKPATALSTMRTTNTLRWNCCPTVIAVVVVGLFAALVPRIATATSIYKVEFSGFYFGRTHPALSKGDRVSGEFFFEANPLPLAFINPNNTVYRQKGRVLDASVRINDIYKDIGNPLDPFNLFSEINDHLPTSPFRFDQVYFGITLATGIRMNVVFQARNTTHGSGRYPATLGLEPWQPVIRVVDFINGPPVGDLDLVSASVRSLPEPNSALLSVIGVLSIAARIAVLRRQKGKQRS